MNEEMIQLTPPSLWKYFDRLNAIPRPSKKEAQVISFMDGFGKGLGLDTLVDEVGNVIIRKPASAGMENRKTVVLQAHLDMVPQKNADVDFDFEKDGIRTKIEGEWVTAEGTTLGADNGIGVAAIMAVLADPDIAHGPLEALFTIDEETGMTGAFGLKGGLLKADILLNLDSEDEGELYIGCAGGVNNNINCAYEQSPAPHGAACFQVSIRGLRGGHSGLDINLGRGNANKLMTRLLCDAAADFDLRICCLHGGNLRNAIPREADATVCVPQEQAGPFADLMASLSRKMQDQLSGTEPDLDIQAAPAADCAHVLPQAFQSQLLAAMDEAPNGVHRMNKNIEGLVDTSTNLAIMDVADGKAALCFLSRSSSEAGKEEISALIANTFTRIEGCTVEQEGAYPGWEPNPDSAILKTMSAGYEALFGKTPEVKAIHAGLECGLLGSHYPGMDMISFGPTIRFPHSPDEKVHIPSVGKFWDYLLHTLAHIPGQ